MATIRARKLADGTVSYTAQIRIKRDGVQVYQESLTFARKQAAKVWTCKRELKLDKPDAIERVSRKRLTLNAMGEIYFGKLTDTDITTQCRHNFAVGRMSKEGGDLDRN